jgi:hypothetical protein
MMHRLVSVLAWQISSLLAARNRCGIMDMDIRNRRLR